MFKLQIYFFCSAEPTTQTPTTVDANEQDTSVSNNSSVIRQDQSLSSYSNSGQSTLSNDIKPARSKTRRKLNIPANRQSSLLVSNVHQSLSSASTQLRQQGANFSVNDVQSDGVVAVQQAQIANNNATTMVMASSQQHLPQQVCFFFVKK